MNKAFMLTAFRSLGCAFSRWSRCSHGSKFHRPLT